MRRLFDSHLFARPMPSINSNNHNLLAVQTDFPPSPPSSNGGACQSSSDDGSETALQQYWDQSIARNMDLPDGYLDVHVLMVKWEDSIDELKVQEEVHNQELCYEIH